MGGRPLPIDSETLLREQAWLLALARSLVGEGAAEDVVQETWLAALARPPAGRARPQIRAFLATVVRRIAGAWRRGEAGRRSREREASRVEEVAPESDALEWLALQRRLAEAIADLREPHRTAIVMRYVEGLAPGAIARRLGETPEALRTRLSRGLEMLRTRLDRECDGERGAWHAVLVGLVARRGAETTALASTLAGALMGSKLFVAASVLVLAAAVLWRWSSEERAEVERPRENATAEHEARAAAPRVEAPPDETAGAASAARMPALASTPDVRPALRGRVVSLADGRPLANASVALQLETPEHRQEMLRGIQELEAAVARGDAATEASLLEQMEAVDFGARREPSASDVVSTTDEDGRFAFDALPAGELALVAAADDHVATLVRGEDLARLADRELDITLAPAGVLDVEVIDESGAPLRDVRVSVTSARSFDPGVPSFAALGDGDGYGPTDLQGRAHIGALPCGVELRVESRPSRTRRIATSAATTTIELERRQAAVQLVVASAGALAGTVRPGPAEGERIEARFRTQSTTKPVSALVQPDGRFLLERVPAVPGQLEIDVIRIGTRATTEVAVERDVAIVPGELTDTGILERAASARLAGHVRDWEGASSDDFVDLRFLRDGRTLARTVLDDEGRFEALLPPGPCALEVVHFEAVLGVLPCSAPDDDLELDLLAFCAGLRGRVPESERELPMFFPHLASGDSADPAQRIAPLPTHGPMRLRAGEFRTLTLAPGPYSLLAPFGERGSAWIPLVVLERGRVADLGQLVAGFGAVRGRVVDEHGEPVPGAEIRVSSSYASVLRTFVERSATSGADGAFEVRGLSAGPWIASARSAGSIGTSEVASVFPDGNTEVEIVLQRSAQLSVRASNGGEPGANEALVLERDGGPERVEGRTSDDGGLELDGLAPGEWRWSLGAAPVRRSGRIELHAGERRALAIEERAHPVRLRFVDAPGEIVEALAWTLDAGEMRRSTRIFADGFELDLEPGRHVIAARTSDAGALQAHVGLVEVPTDARQLDFVPSRLALTVRAGPDVRDGTAPSVSVLAVDGVSVAGWDIPALLAPVPGGWRCGSVLPGATLRLTGAVPGQGRAAREVLAHAERDLALDWP